MICQFCEIEYPAGARNCSQCGFNLVESLAVEGEALTFDPLPIVDDRDTLATLVAQLEAERIPYIVQSGTGLLMFETQSLNEVARPETWEARVTVISSRYGEAEEALRAAIARDAGGPGGYESDDRTDLSPATPPTPAPHFEAIEPK